MAIALHKNGQKLRNPVVETHRFPRREDNLLRGSFVTYQRELVRCGKPRCAKLHGPYWYAYWTQGGRTRSLYIGKQLRPAHDVVRVK